MGDELEKALRTMFVDHDPTTAIKNALSGAEPKAQPMGEKVTKAGLRFAGVGLFALTLAACAPTPTEPLKPTPINTTTPSPTLPPLTLVPLPTETEVPPTPTKAPTATKEPTATAIPTIPLKEVSGVYYPDQTLVTEGYKKFNLEQPVEAKQLKFEVKPNLNDPNKTLIVFGRDPKTGDIILATRMNQQTKELKWNVASIRDFADAAGRRIGTNLSSPYFSSSKIAAHDKIVTEHFNHAVIDYFSMHLLVPQGITPEETSRLNLTLLNNTIESAINNGMTIESAPLLYGQTDFNERLKPYKILADESGFTDLLKQKINLGEFMKMNDDQRAILIDQIIGQTKNPEGIRKARIKLREIIKNYITTVCSETRRIVGGRTTVTYRVVNEYDINPGFWDPYFFLVGPDYVDLAFEIARKAHPEAILILNMGNVNQKNDYYDTITSPVVARLKQKGLIDGIGDQGHEDASNPFNWEQRLTVEESYGLPILITEHDINLGSVSGTEEERFNLQAALNKRFMEQVLKRNIRTITFWESFGDSDSWLERHANGNMRADPTLFDDNGNPKPAYFAVTKALQDVIDGQ